eukprot:TRINITY_DN95_c0_g1_i2.p1 TRINITY_DN95_c0_g1~~TRINITY_DN95_c0_g1_i2.p1  ORF type:complete len:229 (+),score=62.62 TRINITY_DN95_c0_g1_i2:160-846(+)
MTFRRSVLAIGCAAAAAATGNLLFVQPNVATSDHSMPAAASSSNVNFFDFAAPSDGAAAAPEAFTAATKLMAGITLGLMVGFLGAMTPAKAALDRFGIEECDVRKGCNIKGQREYAKAYNKKFETVITGVDRYKRASTGAGVFQKYNMTTSFPTKYPNQRAAADGKYYLRPEFKNTGNYGAPDLYDRLKPYMAKENSYTGDPWKNPGFASSPYSRGEITGHGSRILGN